MPHRPLACEDHYTMRHIRLFLLLLVAIGLVWPAVNGKCSWSDTQRRLSCVHDDGRRALGDATAIKSRVFNVTRGLSLKPGTRQKATESMPKSSTRRDKAKSSTVGSAPSKPSTSFKDKGSSASCPGPPDGSSILPVPLSDSTQAHNVSNAVAAATWWRCVVPGAAAASPPSVGKATLFFVHVPKVRSTFLYMILL